MRGCLATLAGPSWSDHFAFLLRVEEVAGFHQPQSKLCMQLFLPEQPTPRACCGEMSITQLPPTAQRVLNESLSLSANLLGF